MIQAGALTTEDPIELLEGYIVRNDRPRRPPHEYVREILPHVIGPRLPEDWQMRAWGAVTLADSEPEPDLTVYYGTIERYYDHFPAPSEIALVGEVSGIESLERDRSLKLRVYARANIGVYWIINLVDRQVEVYTDPTGPALNPHYRQRKDLRPGDQVTLMIAGQNCGVIAVDDLLPPP